MILSVSRRTDVPRYYFDWFLQRLREGYALVRNPMNQRQVSRVPLSREVVDCIVFWTKDPQPMLGRLEELSGFPYYVQFTLNPYGPEIESGLRPKAALLDTFIALSRAIGPERVVWRYSPVLLNATYTREAHLRFFEETAAALQGYTRQCKLSFLDVYERIRTNMKKLGVGETEEAVQLEMARRLREIAAGYGIRLSACGNPRLPAVGIPPAKCVDDALIGRLLGEELHLRKDPGQRAECSCVVSVDIGAYNSCPHGCAYCYANISEAGVQRTREKYDPLSPLLCGSLGLEDVVRERQVKVYRSGQLHML